MCKNNSTVLQELRCMFSPQIAQQQAGLELVVFVSKGAATAAVTLSLLAAAGNVLIQPVPPSPFIVKPHSCQAVLLLENSYQLRILLMCLAFNKCQWSLVNLRLFPHL